jgi:hypothetical protein
MNLKNTQKGQQSDFKGGAHSNQVIKTPRRVYIANETGVSVQKITFLTFQRHGEILPSDSQSCASYTNLPVQRRDI